jgi:hypothetical protein
MKQLHTFMLFLFMFILLASSLLIAGCTKDVPLTPGSPDNTGNTQDKINTPPEPPSISTILTATNAYQGKILAGNRTPYIEFNNDDYQKATTDGKVILLYFHSDINPICRADEVKIFKAFNSMESINMIGFKVHYEDSAATETEKQLAVLLGVKEPHVKVIVKDGKVMQRNANAWDINDYASQMVQYISK